MTMTHRPTDLLPPHPTLKAYYAGEPEKRAFVRRIFDATAGDYNRVERMMALGSGPWYRRQALKRAAVTHRCPPLRCWPM